MSSHARFFFDPGGGRSGPGPAGPPHPGGAAGERLDGRTPRDSGVPRPAAGREPGGVRNAEWAGKAGRRPGMQPKVDRMQPGCGLQVRGFLIL